MGVIGKLLDSKDDEHIKQILEGREIWIVPVVSPDSYPHSRHVEGVDPNRDFNKEPSANFDELGFKIPLTRSSIFMDCLIFLIDPRAWPGSYEC